MKLSLRNVFASPGGFPVLQAFEMDLSGHTRICFFGPSGCGKTTLLRVLAGLQAIEGGEINGLPERISYVFQEDRLLPWLSALGNVAAVLPHARRGEAAQWLKKTGVLSAANRLPAELSGGMRRRVSFARALAFGGALYLLDEPFHALDGAAKKEMLSLLRREAGTATQILVTHDKEEAAFFGGHVYLLEGPPLRLRACLPANEFTSCLS